MWKLRAVEKRQSLWKSLAAGPTDEQRPDPRDKPKTPVTAGEQFLPKCRIANRQGISVECGFAKNAKVV
jgi:hypothetical protein